MSIQTNAIEFNLLKVTIFKQNLCCAIPLEGISHYGCTENAKKDDNEGVLHAQDGHVPPRYGKVSNA